MITANYSEVIANTARMVADREAQLLAEAHGLSILNITWEDAARYKDSIFGPCISDMTIQVQHAAGGEDPHLTAMPVIRAPNFTDVSGDVSPDRFFVLCGNERGQPLHKITLRELLTDLRQYLHTPDSWPGAETSLLAGERDDHLLVSAQACLLPITRGGLAEFNPVLFNYQSRPADPAVLTILATREGTSVTVIDNVRDPFQAGQTWGQRLFFNDNGRRCSLTAQRKSDFVATAEEPDSDAQSGEGLDLVLLVQVPLKQRPSFGREDQMHTIPENVVYSGGPRGISDLEEAVIGHGEVEGPFTEIDGLPIQRDDRYPVRVTVQFYRGTSNGVVTDHDMAGLAAQIDKVYRQADYVGSLVVEGETGRQTEFHGDKREPPGWWDDFWKRRASDVGQTPEQALELLRNLLGDDIGNVSEEQAEGILRDTHQEGE